MGRNKRPEQPQTQRSLQQGPLDKFLHPQPGTSGELGGPNIAPTSPPGSDGTTLERIEDRLRSLMASMATKDNLRSLTTTIQDTLRAEMAGIRSEVASHAGRISLQEEATEALTARVTTADTAITRQGAMLLSMRT
ncbi:Hypothetical predicted protein [Pelobates cultripes]|uniref:Uncharacterized protein n=1 Tax=Pelobates cultripes TaxID=61616 RepID=A0AAD1SY48_PELCU|nr:Hypothetical predicted protein [Pelobates cultripes]